MYIILFIVGNLKDYCGERMNPSVETSPRATTWILVERKVFGFVMDGYSLLSGSKKDGCRLKVTHSIAPSR